MASGHLFLDVGGIWSSECRFEILSPLLAERSFYNLRGLGSVTGDFQGCQQSRLKDWESASL
jgi:hypothetical protein